MIDADALIEKIRESKVISEMVKPLFIDTVMVMPTVQPEKPKRESRAMLPCKCGCKRREHWYGGGYGGSLIGHTEALVCCKCGFKVDGKNATDVIRRWNKAVSESAVD